jgi:hypothetical protein
MTPDDVTKAIVEAILQGGMQWVVSTIAAFMPALWVLTMIFHLARPYVLRTVSKLSLRFGADVWWLGYVLARDGIMLVTFALSLIFLFPNLMTRIALPLTAPLAALALFASLYIKLLYDSDDDFNAYRWATALLAVGGGLYMIPQIFGIEATSQGWLAPVSGFLTSTSNTGWVGPLVAVALVGYGVIGGLIYYQVAIAGRRFGEKRPPQVHEPATAGA